MVKKNIRQLTQKLIDSIAGIKADIDETAPIGIIRFDLWEWTQGVGLYTLWQYYRLTGELAVKTRIKKWFDARLAEGLPPKNVNTMCPLLTLAFLYEDSKDEAYLPYLHSWAEYAMNGLPRTKEGGIQHIVSGMENKGQLWDDTLYMTVLFLAKYGVLFGRQAFVDESKYQFLLHIKYLTDRKTGLWYHGWSFERKDHFADALWARGNSWFTAAVPDYFELCHFSAAEKRFIQEAYNAQVDGLCRLQSESGLWHTLLDDPDSYLEASASANFAYGILKGIRTGILPDTYAPAAQKAVRALIDCIGEDGLVRQVSYGTGMGETLDFYKEVPLCPMPYGQTLAALVLIEYEKHKPLT
jgi:unsaturated rhamnogalacturonyl hydrolase